LNQPKTAKPKRQQMKVRTFIQQEIEVDVGIDQLFDALQEIPEPERLNYTLGGIGTVHSYLKHIPDNMITAMTEQQRTLIRDGLIKQAGRY
jgi:hypothetical protein